MGLYPLQRILERIKWCKMLCLPHSGCSMNDSGCLVVDINIIIMIAIITFVVPVLSNPRAISACE